MASLTCPLTLQMFVDPVVDNDGNTWERSAIERAIDMNGLSPLTRRPMTKDELRPNRNVREMVEQMAPSQKMEVEVDDDADSLGLTVTYSEDGSCLIRIVPPDTTKQTAVDIVFAVDTSGSTSNSAKEGVESDGLTLLDIFRHGVRTVVQGLSPQDRFALVDWSSTASVVFDLKQATESNKGLFNVKLASMDSSGSTNLWDGCKTALDLLKPTPGRFQAVYVLTDGVPNIVPPRGHTNMLDRYFDGRPDLACSLNMFGFGYRLQSDLLASMARNGSYTFIPDSGMVGTGFINAAARTMTTMAENAVIRLETSGEVSASGNLAVTKASWGYSIDVGNVMRGQSRDIVLQVSAPANATLTYRHIASGEHREALSAVGAAEQLSAEMPRVSFGELVASLLEKCEQRDFDTAEQLRSRFSCDDSNVMKEVGDQVRLAIQPGQYERWGRHYLRSIAPAHFGQYCTNFKDPKMQEYGGRQFQHIRDMLDDCFNKLPAPRPSGYVSREYDSYHSAPSSPVDMSTYNNAAGPCFAGHCRVLMPKGVTRRLCDLIQGDKVWTEKGEDEVLRVVKTPVEAPELHVFPDGLEATPYHPVHVKGQWQFPVDVAPALTRPDCTAVYSLLLKGDSTRVNIEQVDCIVLGHGIADDPVAAHPYFGSQRVRTDILQMHSAKGVVTLKGMERHATTGLVSKLIQ